MSISDISFVSKERELITNVSSTKKTLRLATLIIRELAANYREFFFIQYICLEIYEKITVNSRKLLPYGQWVFDKSRVAPRSGFCSLLLYD